MKSKFEQDYKSVIFILTRISLFKIPVVSLLGIIGLIILLVSSFNSFYPYEDDSLGWAIMLGAFGFVILAIPLMYTGILAVLHSVFIHKRNATGAFITLLIYTITTFGIYISYIPAIILEMITENDYEIDENIIFFAILGVIFLLGSILFLIVHIVGIVKLYKIDRKEKALKMEIGEKNAQDTNN